MSLKIMQNRFLEERLKDISKMTQSQFPELMMTIQMMKFLSLKVRRETTHKKARESKDPTLAKHKLSASKKNSLMKLKFAKIHRKVLLYEIKKELTGITSLKVFLPSWK